MKNNKFHIVGTVLNFNRKNIKIDTQDTQLHDRSLSWLGTGVTEKSKTLLKLVN